MGGAILVALVPAFLIGWILTALVVRWARRLGLNDRARFLD